MRGIVYTLICSMFLNSTLGFLPNDTLSFGAKQVSAYDTNAISENQIMALESDSKEENTVSKNDRDVDSSNFDINDYIIKFIFFK